MQNSRCRTEGRKRRRNGRALFCRHGSLLLFLHLALSVPVPADEEANGTFENSLEMVFRRIPKGTFRVGPPGIEKQKAVLETGNPAAGDEATIERDFYLCAHEVRVRDYRAFCQATGHPQPKGEHYDIKTGRWIPDYAPLEVKDTGENLAMPITCVAYDDAVAFCKWLSKEERRKYRLPTEVEWEYAARAGSDLPYQSSADFDMFKVNGDAVKGTILKAYPEEVLLDGPEEKGGDKEATLKPGMEKDFPPNKWGLYHMLGNVQEFVEMTVEPPKGDVPLPCFTVLPGKVNRMLRGGSWLHDKRDCTVFRANYNCPPYTNSTIGFRVLLEVETDK